MIDISKIRTLIEKIRTETKKGGNTKERVAKTLETILNLYVGNQIMKASVKDGNLHVEGFPLEEFQIVADETGIEIGRIGLVPKGEWEENQKYDLLDMVGYEGNGYVSKKENNNSTLDVVSDWMLIAKKGEVYFADLTAEDILLLQQPAIEAAEVANEAADAANLSALNANNAADRVDDAIESADLATQNANNAATNANAQRGWQPLLVADTTTIAGKTLLKLSEWIGGTGTKPTTNVGQWQKADGTYTSVASEANDLRGEQGSPFVYEDFTQEQLDGLIKDSIPYQGANKPIDVGEQPLSINGLFEKKQSAFDKSRLAPNGNTHFVRLENVASYSHYDGSQPTGDCIVITLPIRSSIKWHAKVNILSTSGSCSFIVEAYTRASANAKASVIHGTISSIIHEISFYYDATDVKIIVRLNPAFSKGWLKSNIERFYHFGYENVNLSNKNLYKIELATESELPTYTLITTIKSDEFLNSETLYSKDGRIFYSKRFSNDTINDEARSNTFVGLNAGVNSGYGTDNIAIGTRALNGNGDYYVYNCIAIGHESLRKYQLQDSLAIGYRALNKTTTGNRNVAIGNSALLVNETGGFNTALGFHSLWSNVIGNNNVAVGYNALSSVKNNNNTAIGFRAGDGIGTGNDNIAIGTYCMTATSQNVSNIIAIGNGIKPKTSEDTNEIIIGHDVTGYGSNTVVIGNSNIERTRLNGRVEAPSYKVSSLNNPPLSSTDIGEMGEIRITPTHIYVCVASNNWVRTELQSWT